MFRLKTLYTIVSLAGILIGCGKSYGSTGPGTPPPPPPPNSVSATNSLAFTPATLQVSTGDIVTFRFGSVAHNVFFAAQAGAPSNIDGNNANTAIQRQFATPGNYTYSCHIHPQMQGTVSVQ
jgi:plastocyanin